MIILYCCVTVHSGAVDAVQLDYVTPPDGALPLEKSPNTLLKSNKLFMYLLPRTLLHTKTVIFGCEMMRMLIFA